MQSQFVGFNTLKQSVSMTQVLDRYGLLERLKRSGDNLSGVCPVHHGHNPGQFRVSISKNCWICFGDCGVGGSIIDFVARMEGNEVNDASANSAVAEANPAVFGNADAELAWIVSVMNGTNSREVVTAPL